MTDRERLIDAINNFFGCDAAYFDVNPFDLATQIIAEGFTAQKWISVKDRLPEKFKTVLIYCKNKTIRGGTVCHIGSCDNGFWFLARQAGTESFPDLEWEVTHWMPLPQPPKGD